MMECAYCRFLQDAVFVDEGLFSEKSCMVCLHSVSYHYEQSIYSMVEVRPWSSWTANSDKKYMVLNGAASTMELVD